MCTHGPPLPGAYNPVLIARGLGKELKCLEDAKD